jgi:hypothetical protein
LFIYKKSAHSSKFPLYNNKYAGKTPRLKYIRRLPIC